jgi:tellurite resistance protein
MTKRTPNFERILAWHPRAGSEELDDGGPLVPPETDAVISLAYLMATADDDVSDDESHAFRALLDYLAGDDAAEKQRLEALAKRLANPQASFEQRAKTAASTLRRPSAKDRAYKAAYTVRIWDLESNPEEDRYDDMLVAALGLRDDDAAELAQQVNEAIIVD